MEASCLTTADGTAVVNYTYDPYGKLLSTTGSKADILGLYNPLRYRGYVYDQEFCDTGGKAIMRKTAKLLLVCVFFVLFVWIVISLVHLLQFHSIQQYAQKVKAPFYTLVVNGKIIHHPYAVHLDRCNDDSVNNTQDKNAGRIEIPLLTVLNALGATCTENENGTVLIEYLGNEYFLIAQKHAMISGTDESDHEDHLFDSNTNSKGEWNKQNLLLILPEKANNYFREEHGDYIVDLSSLHQLALCMDFTFDFDLETGIVCFYSNTIPFAGYFSPLSH